MKRILWIWLLLLTACQGGESPAERSTLNYLQALAEKDQARLQSYTCPEFEMEALLELDALALVQTDLENVTCDLLSSNGQSAQVACTGSITMTYSGEAQRIDLSARTYSVVHDRESWLVCGYLD
ncbi:MAG: hypothetical protein ACOYZ6_15645 [Chloroflexota bacterium]